MHTHSASAFGRRHLLKVGAAGAAGAVTSLLPSLGSAQGIGGGPIKILIASTPGTGGDTMARMIQPLLQAKWNQPFIVENKPGAAGVIGIDSVASSAPDGHTFMIQTSTMFLLPYFYKMQSDVLKSFQPITQVGWSTFALAVNPNVPAKNFAEFVQWVKASNGKLNYASPGAGTENHVFMEMLKLNMGLSIAHIPYKGAAGAIQDVIGGQVPMMFLPVQTAMNWAKDNRIRVLGVTTKERFPLFPDLPTLSEQGATDFNYTNWYGIWGPAGMSADLVARYGTLLRDVLETAEIKSRFASSGWVVKTSTPEELAQISHTQYEAWGQIVKRGNIKAE
ncbi:Bug family tripartite tricarboxylate transporter substrate binding protein [Hydrogenophaga sp. OTU3427]|uniref:Bug family tripartite tricarboxylate transporter substrate binding protein n=1 Tax=Hydrogenophaga sp. OTU3427 TaxID=3043856 RepID=UPI00313E6AC3